MADFSSLKQTIQTYIKQNGNEEITGNILQDVLLAMVSTMGDSAINSLASALQDEITARQNQDATLQGNITAETTARQQADTALGGRIDGLQTALNGINTKLAEGYIYAGIATPSTNPGTPSGKVFYIAVSSGTYTNFSNLTVAQGINILKYNGSSWSKDVVYTIDPRPKKASQNLVTSGGVFDNIGALDVSELNATENPHTLAQYTDLSSALAAIPTDYQKGGMSIKYVQTSDNKYIQARLMADSFTTDITQWQSVDDEPAVNSDNLVKSGGVIENLKDLGLYNTITADITTWQEGKYINVDGQRSNNSSYNITNRTAVQVGDVVTITAYALSNVALIAKYGGYQSHSFVSLLTGKGNLSAQRITISEDCEIVFSYDTNYSISVSILRSADINRRIENNEEEISVLEKKTSDKNLSEISFESTSGKYVNYQGGISSSASFSYSKPVFITKGTTVIINASGYNSNVCMLAKVVTEDSLYIPLVISESNKTNYIYYIKESAYYAFSYNNTKEHVHYRLIEYGLLLENNIYDYLSLFKNCICIGDSLTRGYQSSYPDHERNRDGGYPTRLSRMTRLNVYNYGISGATPTTMYEHLTEITRDYSIFDVALICLGRNEKLTPSEDQTNYANIITLLKTANPHITVFCLSLPPSGYGEVIDEPVNERIKTIATNNNCYYIDIYHDTIIQDASYRDDSVHYKTLGYMLMAEVIKCRINEYIGANHAAFMDLWVDDQYHNVIDGLVE